MKVGERRRLLAAVGISEWQTFIDHAKALAEWPLVIDLQDEQLDMMVMLLMREGYLFYEGETSLKKAPELARRYCTEHLSDVLNLEREGNVANGTQG